MMSILEDGIYSLSGAELVALLGTVKGMLYSLDDHGRFQAERDGEPVTVHYVRAMNHMPAGSHLAEFQAYDEHRKLISTDIHYIKVDYLVQGYFNC